MSVVDKAAVTVVSREVEQERQVHLENASKIIYLRKFYCRNPQSVKSKAAISKFKSRLSDAAGFVVNGVSATRQILELF